MTGDEIQELVSSAIERFREVSSDLIGDDAEDDETECVMRAVFEAVCYEMGYVEGFATLLGVDATERDSIRRAARQGGMTEALRHHDDGPCTGCSMSENLRSELQNN